MDDNNTLQSNEKRPLDSADEKEAGGQKQDFLTGVLENLKANREKKYRARTATRLEIFCFIIIVVFTAYFKADKYAGQSTPLLYYYESATVTDVAKADDRWKVTIRYLVGNEFKYKHLYYRKNPAYVVGDTVKLKIQTVNPDNIEIAERNLH